MKVKEFLKNMYVERPITSKQKPIGIVIWVGFTMKSKTEVFNCYDIVDTRYVSERVIRKYGECEITHTALTRSGLEITIRNEGE